MSVLIEFFGLDSERNNNRQSSDFTDSKNNSEVLDQNHLTLKKTVNIPLSRHGSTTLLLHVQTAVHSPKKIIGIFHATFRESHSEIYHCR